jgi:choline dehydrogenase-like flavoprotein
MIGGSTGLNLLAWDRASKAEYDAWAELGEDGSPWTFDSLMPFFIKTETLSNLTHDVFPGISPSEEAAAQQAFKRRMVSPGLYK